MSGKKPIGNDTALTSAEPAPTANVVDEQLRAALRASEEVQNLEMLPGVEVASLTRTTISYSGPLPPPEELAGYNRVVPGLADTIVRSWTDETAHRRELENQEQRNETWVVRGTIGRQCLGLMMGFAIACLGFYVALRLGLAGYPWAAVIVGGLELCSLAGVFVVGTRLRRKRSQ